MPKEQMNLFNAIERIEMRVHRLEERKDVCFKMALVFVEQHDGHGLHDMGVEIQALDRAITELNAVLLNQ